MYKRIILKNLMESTAGESFLSELPVGKEGRIISILAGGSLRNRFLDLGMVTGTLVKAVRRSPVGDPTAYLVRGALIALRREESGKIIVSTQADNQQDYGRNIYGSD